MARQEIFKMHLCAPYGIPATGSCHSQHHQQYCSEKMGVSEKSAHKQKENRHTFLTTPGTSTFHEAVPDCFIVLISSMLLNAQESSTHCPKFNMKEEKISQ